MSIKAMTHVWDHSEADGTELLVLLAIAWLMDNNFNWCKAQTKDLAKLCRLEERNAQRIIQALKESGAITVRTHPGCTPESAKEQLEKKIPQELEGAYIGIDKKICAWCKGTTLVLHAHHYPIPKSKGGTETVNICPNCHAEFHEIVGEKNIITIVGLE